MEVDRSKYERKKREKALKFKGKNYEIIAEKFSWIFHKFTKYQVSEKWT